MKNGSSKHHYRAAPFPVLKDPIERKKSLSHTLTTKNSNSPGKTGGNNDPDILKQVFDAWHRLS